jgi:hypothetical protein
VPKPKLRLRDWLFGAGGRRRLLAVLLAEPTRTWTQVELARAADLTTKGAVDEHLLAMRQLRLVRRYGHGYRVVAESEFVEPILSLLALLDGVPDRELRRPK